MDQKQFADYIMKQYSQSGGRPGPVSGQTIQKQIGGSPDVRQYILDKFRPAASGPMPTDVMSPDPMSSGEATLGPVEEEKKKPDYAYLAAQMGQGMSEAASGMVTPGDILLKTQRSQPSQYVAQYLQKKQLGLAENKDKRDQEAEKRAQAQEAFAEEQRAEQRTQLAIQKQQREASMSPDSQVSQGRRAAIEAVYPQIKDLAPTFDKMSATELEKAMPMDILKTIQDVEEAKMRSAESAARRDLLHQEKKDREAYGKEKQQIQIEDSERKRGVVPAKIATEFRALSDLKKRTENITKLWGDFKSNTGPLIGRWERSLANYGIDGETSELQAEIGRAFAEYVKSISGAAVSEAEFQRLARNLPQITDAPGRFEAILKSWVKEQESKLSSLAVSEANKEVGNEYLRKNIQAELQSLNPNLKIQLVKDDQGASRYMVLDRNDDADALVSKQAEINQRQQEMTQRISGYIDKAKKNSAGENQVIILTNTGQKMIYMPDSNTKAFLTDIIARNGKVDNKKGMIIIDNREYKAPQEKAFDASQYSTANPEPSGLDFGY